MIHEHPNGASSTAMFQQLGAITRQLHDALKELGYADRLKGTLDQLPDAQSRLSYIARLTGEAAEKVLNRVEAAKTEQGQVFELARQLAQQHPALAAPLNQIAVRSQSTDAHLTEIMLAQDFHDLTGQVIDRVAKLASTIEEQLLALLLQSASAGQAGPGSTTELGGPVHRPEGRGDVVSDQKQVDELLASLGF